MIFLGSKISSTDYTRLYFRIREKEMILLIDGETKVRVNPDQNGIIISNGNRELTIVPTFRSKIFQGAMVIVYFENQIDDPYLLVFANTVLKKLNIDFRFNFYHTENF